MRTTLLEEISEYEELVERKSSLQDSLNRTNVKSPENGIIKQRFVDTIGGVIKAGEPLFDIVPINDKLIVQAKLSVDQIGYIQKGQKVNVKLGGKNNRLYDSIVGNVVGDAIYSEKEYKEPLWNKNWNRTALFWRRSRKILYVPGTQVLAMIEIDQEQ